MCIRDRPHGVEVALSKGAEHSGELVRRWVQWLAGKDDVASREEGLPVLELWGERAWLSEDPSQVRVTSLSRIFALLLADRRRSYLQDEVTLLDLDDLNELAACAVLGVCSASDFVALSTEDRVAIFARLIGTAAVVRSRTAAFLKRRREALTLARAGPHLALPLDGPADHHVSPLVQ